MNQSKTSMEKRTVLKIGGMHCAGCVNSIQNQLLKLDGIKKCEVNLASEKAVIEFDPTATDIKKMEKSIQAAGYSVVYEKLKLKVSGITDASDANKLEKTLMQNEGIKIASVNYGNGQILAEYNSVLISLSDIRKILSNKGYEILSEDLSASAEEIEAKKTFRLFVLGVIFTIPVVVFGHHLEFLHSIPLSGTTLSAYIMFACATIVQFVIGSRFYFGAIRAAKIKSANMDTLIVIGTTTAYVFSVFNTFPTPIWDNIHYDAAVVVTTFILLGKYLENKTKGKASSILKKMLEIQPKSARVRYGNEEKDIPIELIKPGDTIVVRPGEKIPVDCMVIEGSSAVDESMVTGESIPQTKKAGDVVIGGTINKEGAFIVRATKVGSDTFLAQVVNLVEEAMGKKPPMQRLVDKVAGYFAFIVVGVALATFLAWYLFGNPGIMVSALIPAVAILVVACPCALGLATPTAIMVGISKAAQNGVIFKGGNGLELLGKTNTIVFDKTGTLTIGKPEVTDILPLKEITVSTQSQGSIYNDVLQVASTVERNSEHPLAKAVIQKANEGGIEISEASNFVTVPGRGVKGESGGKSLMVGSTSMMKDEGLDLSPVNDSIRKLQEDGKTVSLVAVDRKILGIIAFQDSPKPTAKDAVHYLNQKGLDVVMLTGDNEKTALAVAKKIGINKVIANVMPYDKVEEVEKLQKQGKIVAMVGDGINDAPALTQADVGIAIGSGTDVALEAGMVILVKDNLIDVIAAIEISKKTLSKIKQNLFYAFIYNTILIPVAGFGLLYPALAGLAMAASSVSVVSSSLILKRWTPPSKRR